MKWLFLFWGTSVFALPQNPLVVSQDAQIHIHSPEVMEIAAQDGTMIEWSDFSIGTPETVRFSQPSVEAVVLNRVVGSEMSQILGKLEANGKVLLINPSGVLFGQEARIDTGSFIASTLDLNRELFEKTGDLEFTGNSNSPLVNEGAIFAGNGDLFLIGHHVENKGAMKANGAFAGLIGASSVLIKPNGTDRLFIRTSTINDGQNPYANAFSVVEGNISNPGGSIYLLGDTVGISSAASIDVSSDLGGGKVYIGGDYQGKNPDLLNASWTFIEKGAWLRADALECGDGGRVIIWANQDTVFQGNISAGGKGEGAGGFAEVSGKRNLHYQGLADLRDEKGNAGTLHLDPTQITIAAATAGVALGNCGFPGNTYASNVIAGTLLNTTLEAQWLAANTVITTSDGTCGPFAGTGNILVNSNVIPMVGVGTPFSLTLNAANDIFVNADIQNFGIGAVTLLACRNVTIDSNTPVAQSAAVGSRAGITIVTAGNDLTLNGSNTGFTATQIGWRAVAGDVITGPIFANAVNNISINSGLGSEQGAVIGHGAFYGGAPLYTVDAPVTVRAGGNITLLTLSGNHKGSVIGHGGLSLFNNMLTGAIEVTCGGDLTLRDLVVGAVGSHATIGFFIFNNSGPPTRYAGSIVANVGGNFLVDPTNGVGFKTMGIGTSHHGITSDTVAVTAHVRGSVTLNGDAGAGQRAFIGKMGFFTGGGTILDGDVIVNCGGPILMNAVRAEHCFIGYSINPGYSGNVDVFVNSGSINIVTIPGSPRTFIGMTHSPYTVPGLYTVTGNTTVNSTGTIMINGAATSGINSNGFVTVQANGDITAFGTSFIGTERPNLAVTTRILSGGNIMGTSPAVFGNGFLGFSLVNFPIATRINSLNMGAAGNIQMPNDFLTTTGAITIAASTPITGFNIFVPAFTTNFTNCLGQLVAVALPSFNLLLNTFSCGAQGCLNFVPTNPPILLQTTGGPIALRSGPQSGGFACNLRIGNQPGDDVRLATITGNIEVIGSAAAVFSCPDPCRGNSFNDVTINQNICTTGDVLIAANHNLTMEPNSSIGGTMCPGLPRNVTLIVDNEFPVPFLIGPAPGGFFMDSNAEINSVGPIRIFTALQGINMIDGLIRTVRFSPGTLYACTNQESWCTYFCAINRRCPMSGTPFTISYKDGCVPVPPEVPPIIMEFLVDLHPYNEFPGWMMRFWVVNEWQPLALYSEPYMLRRRHLNLLNHPKSWSQMMEDRHTPPKEL